MSDMVEPVVILDTFGQGVARVERLRRTCSACLTIPTNGVTMAAKNASVWRSSS